MPKALRRSTAALLALACAVVAVVAMPVPRTTASAQPTAPVGLYVSLKPDRSGAVLLSGQSVPANTYMFFSKAADANKTSGVVSVEFLVDGVYLRTEGVSPFDLGGTEPDWSAGRFSTSSLTPGTHRIDANVRWSNGNRSSYRGTFVTGTTTTTAAPTTTTAPAPSPTTTVAPAAAPAPAPTGSKVPRFASSSFWYHRIPHDVALNPLSASYVANFDRQWKAYYNNVGINTTTYAPPIWVASATTPNQHVRVWDCQNKGYLDADLQAQLAAVPLPPGAKPSAGTDNELVISQPSTDTIWEMWQARWASDGVLEACWGGKLTNVSSSQGIFPRPFGTTATGLSLVGGLITPEELRAGQIDHALAISLAAPQAGLFSWPANRTDGWANDTTAIPEGLRLRLDPTINVDALPISTTAKIVAKALQTYGMVVRDKSGAVTFYAENVFAETGSDPYPALFGAPGYAVLNGIPWDRLQALPHDYGR